MKYRPEIDGLRTVAVVPVILFHAGFEVFSGGFVGVDIFFVISGYLITSIIVSDLEQEKFSLLNFYERRARRILPALFFVLLACLPFAWLWLLPPDMKDFAQSLVAVSTFSSNILFWRETGYFATTSELKPLLHTWSLAVEEQYYIFFPLFMMITWRLGRRWVLGLIAVAFVVSLGLGHWGALNKPNAAFFLLPTRAWELLVGVFAAFYLHDYLKFHHGLDRRIHQALSLLGFLMVTYSIFVFDERTAFPGLPALVPTVGAGLIIMFASQGTWVNRLLSIKGFVGIGLISYSAYLWHNPLMVFARHRSLTEPSLWLMGGLCIVTLVMAYISWRYVELPFRNKQTTSRKMVFSAGAAMAALIICIGLFGHFAKGVPSRLPEAALAALSGLNGDTSGCHNKLSADEIKSGIVCKIGADTPADIAIIGDSHAAALTDAFSEELEAQRKSALTFNGSWCAPLLGLRVLGSKKNPECYREIKESLTVVANNMSIKKVILIAEWSNYTEGMRWGDRVRTIYGYNADFGRTADENTDFVEKSLFSTIKFLKKFNKEIYILKDSPEYNLKIPDFIAKTIFYKEDFNNEIMNIEKYKNRNIKIEKIFKKKFHGVIFIDTLDLFCSRNMCEFMTEDMEPLYKDGNHLSYKGSERVVKRIFEKLYH